MRDIVLEIFEGERCSRHKLGQKFNYPGDSGKVCPWLMASARPMIKVLRYDGRLGWSYKGTPYEKMINKDGVSTEFVRCPDPTSAGVVLKITATKRMSRKKT
ncbi:MAG: TIGR04076 family protein [Candidatus Thorarchaeota archaeon]